VYGELLDFESGDKGIVIEFDEDKVVALLVGSGIEAKTGDKVISKGEMFKVPVTEKLVGRVVNGLLQPIDGKGPVTSSEYGAVFADAPPIMSRIPIDEALKTGLKVIDTMIPIGKGQRELIIGDRQTGKTTIAIDAIINQKDENVTCIFCWVGGSYNAMVKMIELLAVNGALDHTVFVAAPASTSSTEQYLAPYVATAVGEYFMNRKKDVLIVFDNLTKHAWIYRQISLLLNRSPGREAYPGDIFYVHSQLVERAARLDPKIGGSMTCFPIIDTLQGDVTGYIQTNLVSMTDGQIYTNAALFNEGFKPAVDIGLSVSRIGSKVQSEALKEVSAKLRLEYAQFKELQKITKLRAKISDEMARKIKRGQTLSDLLVQNANSPISEIKEILIFYAFSREMLNDLNKGELRGFESTILDFIDGYDPELLKKLTADRQLTEGIKKKLDKALEEYFKEGSPDRRVEPRRNESFRMDGPSTGRRTPEE
jgi:F-type H+-transporting ATPase subunit alpha